jgi:hypothetical protein
MHDCPDHEDNLVLDLAAEVGALLLVSEDTDLTIMFPLARRTDPSSLRIHGPCRRDATTSTPQNGALTRIAVGPSTGQ